MLGARIAALRKTGGLSQAELAQRLGISPSAVGMYEQGRREPAAETLVKLAEVFDVSTDYLLTGRSRETRDSRRAMEALCSSLAGAGLQLRQRKNQPFTPQELTVLFAAMLMEP